MSIHVGDLRARAERAQSTFEEGRDRLLRPDGSKLFSEAEHAEQMSTLRAERNRVLDEVSEQLRSAFQEGNAEITNLENRDPQELLSPEELERANAKRGFANDQAETLDLGALRSRLESVLAGGDKASIFSFWMAGQRRRAEVLATRRESARRAEGTVAGGAAAAAQVSTATELDEVLDKMHQALDAGQTAAAIEAARGRLEKIADVEQIVYFSRHETTSIYNPNYAIPGR